jgi:hypothetical protein
MRILSIRPVRYGNGKTVARFDMELSPGVKCYDLKLVDGDNGWRVFGPSIGGGAAVTFSIDIATQIAELALGELALDRRAAA